MFLFAIISGNVYAVEWVYRVDGRPPDVVFRDGFRSHGGNRNLQQHIRGDSCAAGTRDSAFIATTTDINETYNIARQYYSNSLFHGRLYRYRIRADNGFYPLGPSVHLLMTRGVQFSRFEQMMMTEQQEIVAVSYISPSNIIDAVELNYNRLTSTVTDGSGTSNASYSNIHTEANTGVIPDIPVPQVSHRERISAFGTLLTACFSLRGINRQRDRDTRDIYDPIQFYDARGVMKTILSKR
ncbi:pertussis toxin-like subunit ArtA [Escherichia coli]|uniref:scabin-related ADP-ribosyltransferase n=1 Tax=Escherichia coli TaxID=562 RepID=UPI0013697727|nr:pertussis toxin-like subunit ArtA [Escherichia coli]EEW1020525.1 pertussis toxin-like subunit ArtA [Escherichia coli]MEB6310531.1 pertussis toxin-like subunit ArtA [Escherichia coli]MXE06321.1 pertussis toxin-like subunit ArtA [Escherichia coli]HAW1694389.1 pertussis toxin-like subunit ArtA [Escherichia coli]HAW1703721.1 pertussis toxin-like subunit ArtA [Escherichia coli]